VIKKFGSWIGLLLILGSCATSYIVPLNDYVAFNSDDQLVSSEQKMAFPWNDYKMDSTWDDEYTYDSQGNMVKHIQTEYFGTGSGKRYIEWTIEYKVVGGKVVPYRAMANGVQYAEVEYQVLPGSLSGPIEGYTEFPRFRHFYQEPLGPLEYVDWTIGPVFSVVFRAEEEFVERVGGSNYLTYGYDNLVLVGFSYSRRSLNEGIAKSFPQGAYYSKNVSRDVSEVELRYQYELIAGKVCQTTIDFHQDYGPVSKKFLVERNFDSSGRKVEEKWTYSSPQTEKGKDIELFHQVLEIGPLKANGLRCFAYVPIIFFKGENNKILFHGIRGFLTKFLFDPF